MRTCTYTRQHYRSFGARPTNRVGAPESRVFETIGVSGLGAPFLVEPLVAAKSGRDHPSKNGHVRRRFGLALKRSPPRAPILPGYQANTTNRD